MRQSKILVVARRAMMVDSRVRKSLLAGVTDTWSEQPRYTSSNAAAARPCAAKRRRGRAPPTAYRYRIRRSIPLLSQSFLVLVVTLLVRPLATAGFAPLRWPSEAVARAWVASGEPGRRRSPHRVHFASSSCQVTTPFLFRTRGVEGRLPRLATAKLVEPDSLMEMDVVVYSVAEVGGDCVAETEEHRRRYLGAIQEDGSVAPLSAWTDEPAFGESIGFVVDERAEFASVGQRRYPQSIRVHAVVPEHRLTYGSRQVGGGKGPGNPHGEESERLYYVELQFLEEHRVHVIVNPELDIVW